MARPGTRRYAVDLLANMRLFDSTIKSIKEGREKLDKVTVRALETFTALPAKERERRSFGQYEKITKNYSSLIRKTEDKALKEELRKAERQAQLKAVFGKDILTKDQYKKINKLLSEMGLTHDDISEYWGY